MKLMKLAINLKFNLYLDCNLLRKYNTLYLFRKFLKHFILFLFCGITSVMHKVF